MLSQQPLHAYQIGKIRKLVIPAGKMSGDRSPMCCLGLGGGLSGKGSVRLSGVKLTHELWPHSTAPGHYESQRKLPGFQADNMGMSPGQHLCSDKVGAIRHCPRGTGRAGGSLPRCDEDGHPQREDPRGVTCDTRHRTCSLTNTTTHARLTALRTMQ